MEALNEQNNEALIRELEAQGYRKRWVLVKEYSSALSDLRKNKYEIMDLGEILSEDGTERLVMTKAPKWNFESNS